jgi:hypothetical protein
MRPPDSFPQSTSRSSKKVSHMFFIEMLGSQQLTALYLQFAVYLKDSQ